MREIAPASTNFTGAQYVETPALAQWISTNRARSAVGDLLAAKGSAPRISQGVTASCADMASVQLQLGTPTNCAQVTGGLELVQPQLGGCTLAYGQYKTFLAGPSRLLWVATGKPGTPSTHRPSTGAVWTCGGPGKGYLQLDQLQR